jgi:polysaccharide export outer membrane protein
MIYLDYRHRAWKSVLSLFMGAGIVALVWIQATAAAPPTSPSVPSAAPQSRGEYLIHAGDLLHVFVWREPELTREVRVRPDGKLTIPLVGDINADGQTPEALSVGITEKLRKFLNGPQVTVGVIQASTLRFFVMGRVGKAGEYPLLARTTVLQGLAVAGGLAEYAKAEEILVVRHDHNGAAATPSSPAEAILKFDLKRLVTGHDVSQNVLLQPGDTIVVP